MTTHYLKQCRPDEKETAYFWKLFHAAQHNDSRGFGSSLRMIAEELANTNLERHEKLFLLRAWQVLVDDKGGFGRFMGAFDTYVYNMQDPDDDCCAWKPDLAQLLHDGSLLPVLFEAYQESQQRIAELEQSLSAAENNEIDARCHVSELECELELAKFALSVLQERNKADQPVEWQIKSAGGGWLSVGKSGREQAVREGCEVRGLYTAPPVPAVPNGYSLVPVEPTEDMIIAGFESEPDEHFSRPEEWEHYEAMSGCQQAAHKARLCWSAMLRAAPKYETTK